MTKRHLISLLALAIVLYFGCLWLLRSSQGRVRGDEGTYLAMAESLARDGDLWFDERDQSRLEEDARPGRKAVILQRVGSRVAYSKPILYPLLAAPLVRVFGERGLVLLNGLAFGGSLLLLAGYLRRLAPDRGALPTLIAYAGLSLLVPYVAWRTSDALQAAFALGGLALCFRERLADPRATPVPGNRRSDLWGGLLLGLVVSMRLTNAVVAAIPVVALWLEGRRRRAVEIAALMGVTLVLGAAMSLWLAGAASPYTAVRATFNPETGYPTSETGMAGARSPFDYDRASYDGTKKLLEAPRASLYGAVYFLVGRHTGILFYFPLAAFLVASALRRPDRTAWVVVLAVAGLAAFYLVFLPFNYFGGATCVGNRYFLVSYAALPFALRRPIGRVRLTAAWGLALLVATSALVSVLATRDRDASTQNHAHAGLFRWLPYETTAAGLDGGRDVYWIKEFARFVDPYAAVGRWSFRLDAEDPPAELEVANLRRNDKLRFLVVSTAPELELVYRDWAQEIRVPLEKPMGLRGLVEIEPARPLRVHPLWFRNVWDHGLPYFVRVFRLAIRTPGGEPAQAEIRYLGREPWPEEVFSNAIVRLELPSLAVAGSVTEIPVRVRNSGSETWPRTGPLPVVMSYRLTPLDPALPAVEGPRSGFRRPIDPGGEGEVVIAVHWPEQPGEYRLRIDLLIEGVAWFAERTGRPLGEGTVRVVLPEPAGS